MKLDQVVPWSYSSLSWAYSLRTWLFHASEYVKVTLWLQLLCPTSHVWTVMSQLRYGVSRNVNPCCWIIDLMDDQFIVMHPGITKGPKTSSFGRVSFLWPTTSYSWWRKFAVVFAQHVSTFNLLILLATNISSPQKVFLKMIFLFLGWDICESPGGYPLVAGWKHAPADGSFALVRKTSGPTQFCTSSLAYGAAWKLALSIHIPP